MRLTLLALALATATALATPQLRGSYTTTDVGHSLEEVTDARRSLEETLTLVSDEEAKALEAV